MVSISLYEKKSYLKHKSSEKVVSVLICLVLNLRNVNMIYVQHD